jgi:uncharacterized protein (DUF427 family)
VWDYPRPPRCEPVPSRIEIVFDGRTVVSTDGAFRVLETSHPPTYYLPPSDFVPGALVAGDHGSSWCEWKGMARYWSIVGPTKTAQNCAWSYPTPTRGYEELAGYVAVYAHMMDRCTVGGETVTPQPGNFYGGWVTDDIVGPFKGVPGSNGW